MKVWLVFLMFWLTAAHAPAYAHEVHHRIEASGAVAITLTYANGAPFAYEKYALYPAGQETPMQVGNTDAAGRVVFMPGATEQWRLQANSADGHGVNLEFAAPATAAAMSAPTPAAEQNRWLLGGFGLALIFGLFGLVQLFMRHRKPS
jgi:nickel transport protein